MHRWACLLKHFAAILALLGTVCLTESFAQGQTGFVAKPLVSTVTDKGMPTNIVKPDAQWNFGPGALQTYAGWQYAAFWDTNRQVTVARRKLPQGRWQCVSLGGYQRTSNINRGKAGPKAQGFGDGHEKVAMGISSDGVIHLAFDHHVSTLHYRHSKPGLANNPAQFAWSEELFSVVQDNLDGPSIETVTYPNFVRDGKRLSLYLRLNRGSGSADSHFFEYEAGSWTVNDPKSSKLIDKNWSGGDGTVNAYPHTMVVHNGRRHLTWCWRDTSNARTCHDLCYAFSDDHGVTWKNNAGQQIARRGSEFISADSAGIAVLDIPPGSSYVNGGSMTVDFSGGVHVLMKGPNRRPLFAHRNPSTGEWTRREGATIGNLVTADQELLVVAESGLYQESRNAPQVFENIGLPIEKFVNDSRFAVDPWRWHYDKTISVIGQNGTDVKVIDFDVRGQ